MKSTEKRDQVWMWSMREIKEKENEGIVKKGREERRGKY